MLYRRVFLLCLSLANVSAFQFRVDTTTSLSRRNLLTQTAKLVSLSTLVVPPARAFDNKLDGAFEGRTPATGRQPDNLGVATRTSITTKSEYQGLAPCDGRPNCWCSSTPFSDAPARHIDTWESPSGESSIADVKSVIDTYEVGQQGIDGGGFQIVEYDEKAGYIYVQFQSFRAGYIDDTEFWYNPEKKQFDVRSASRLGQSDLGVNAKRLEYIGGRLEKEFGWKLRRRKSGSLV